MAPLSEKSIDRIISAVQAILIAAIAALASYYSATSEARDHNNATNKRADIGYETLVKNIEDLQKEVSTLRARRWVDDTTIRLPTSGSAATAWVAPPQPLDPPPPTLVQAVNAVDAASPAPE